MNVMRPKPLFDFEGHRGCRGLMPENTIAAMKHAIDLGVTTLELDLLITHDKQVVVTHDPVLSSTITSHSTGDNVTAEAAANLIIYQMDYDALRNFHLGLHPHPLFPRQEKIPAYIPLLAELIYAVQLYVNTKSVTVFYNLEIKSLPAGDGKYHPPVEEFCELVMEVVTRKEIANRIIVSSFDVRVLQYLRMHYPTIELSYLVEEQIEDIDALFRHLSFVAERFSPEHSLITTDLIEACHRHGAKVIAWTVNEVAVMKNLMRMGVDGIISDYPDRFALLTEG